MIDPTIEEMRSHLQSVCPGSHDFDVEGAIYWFACDYHAGQWTNLYAAMSRSEYKPGAMEAGPDQGSDMQNLYEILENEYGNEE